jgi:hypothetical protein
MQFFLLLEKVVATRGENIKGRLVIIVNGIVGSTLRSKRATER